MSALAAGCRSGGRAGYSNAAVAYFVALAFGWAALEERVSDHNRSQTINNCGVAI